jgi:hypothetical protein
MGKPDITLMTPKFVTLTALICGSSLRKLKVGFTRDASTLRPVVGRTSSPIKGSKSLADFIPAEFKMGALIEKRFMD